MVNLSHARLESLCRTLGVDAEEVSVTALSGGLYGRSYCISSARGDWAVRLPLRERAPGSLDPSVERRLLEILGDVEITPPLARGRADCEILVTRYLSAATTWAAADARDADNIARLVARLRELHRVAHDLPPFVATQVAEHYCRLAAVARQLTAEQREWGRELAALARAYDADSHPATLCHNDLVAANILDDSRLWLIDFEYAVLAEPILDLASLAGMNDFSPDQQTRLVDAYYHGADRPFTMAKFTDVVRLIRLVSYFWALAGHREDYPDAAAEQFVEKLTVVLR